MPNLYLLVNTLDQLSRDYVNQNPDFSAYTEVIDWYLDQPAVDVYLKAGGQHPSSFPCVMSITPPPDLATFKQLVLMDTNIPFSAKTVLFTFVGLLTDLVNSEISGVDPPAVIQQVWAGLKSEAPALGGLCTDNKTIISDQIEAYAGSCGIYLVPLAQVPEPKKGIFERLKTALPWVKKS